MLRPFLGSSPPLPSFSMGGWQVPRDPPPGAVEQEEETLIRKARPGGRGVWEGTRASPPKSALQLPRASAWLVSFCPTARRW